MAKTKIEGCDTMDVEKLEKENNLLRKKLAETDELLLLAHKLCWLFARTPRSASQKEAYRNLDRMRKAVGEERAEELEKEWRGVTVKRED